MMFIFEKCRIEPESPGNMGEYDPSYFKEIFPEEKLEEYIRELEIIWNKKRCNTEVDGKGKGDSVGYDSSDNNYEWFYTKRVPYSLEVNENMNREIKDEKLMKNENSIIPHNSKEIKANTEVKENNLIVQYDEETVLLQIPQDDTRVEDIVKKFKNQNKVIDTIVALKDKRKIIDGQGYMRRLVDAEAAKNSDVPISGVNRWTCGDCGKKFHSQEPYRNCSDHAICDECNDKSISSGSRVIFT